MNKDPNKPATQELLKFMESSAALTAPLEDVLNYGKPEDIKEAETKEIVADEERGVDNFLKAEYDEMEEEIKTLKEKMAIIEQQSETKTELLGAKTGRTVRQ